MRGGSDRRGSLRAAAVLLVIATCGTVFVPPTAQAHSPHDVVWDVELSPEFAEDHTVYAIVRGNLLQSSDRGDTWVRLVRGLDNKWPIRAVEIAPTNKEVLYAGSLGDGLYRSSDGGHTWVRPAGQPGLSVKALTISPHSPNVLIVTIKEPDGPVMAITVDGGATWRSLEGVAPPSVVAFAPDDPQTLLAGSANGAVLRSRDAGATWEKVFTAEGAGAATALAYAPDGSVFLGTSDGGLWRADAFGEPLTRIAAATGGQVESVMFSAAFPADRTMWLSTRSGGAFRSEDGGASWSPFSDGLTTDGQSAQLDEPDFGQMRISDGLMFLASFDGLFRSNGSEGWEEMDTQTYDTLVSVAVSPNYGSDGTVAVATYHSGTLISVDGGASWTPMNDGLSPVTGQQEEDRFVRLFSIAFSPSFATDRTLFTSKRGAVLRSDEAGSRWASMTPNGLLVDGELPPDYPLFAFSPDYEDDATLLLGTDGGKVFRSTDGGLNFTKVGQVDAPILAIVASPSFASDGVLLAGTIAGLRRSHDKGETWESVGTITDVVTSLAASTELATDHPVYAGTSVGLFVSRDRGETWAPALTDLFGRESFIEAVVLSPAFASDRTMFVSVRGRGLFRSVDGGATFVPAGDDLLASGHVLANFYQDTTEPIVFSPDFAQDHTIFGMAETRLFKSVNGGDSWEAIALPWDSPTGGDRLFDSPLGRLSPAGVLTALVMAASTLALPSVTRRIRGVTDPSTAPPVWARRIAALAVMLIALVVMAA